MYRLTFDSQYEQLKSAVRDEAQWQGNDENGYIIIKDSMRAYAARSEKAERLLEVAVAKSILKEWERGREQ